MSKADVLRMKKEGSLHDATEMLMEMGTSSPKKSAPGGSFNSPLSPTSEGWRKNMLSIILEQLEEDAYLALQVCGQPMSSR